MSAAPRQGSGRAGRRAAARLLSPSLAWLAVFFLCPLAVMLAYSLARRGAYGTVEWTLGWGNYVSALEPLYWPVYWR